MPQPAIIFSITPNTLLHTLNPPPPPYFSFTHRRYGSSGLCQPVAYRSPTPPARVIEPEDDLRDLYFIILGGIALVAIVVVASRWFVKGRPPSYLSSSQDIADHKKELEARTATTSML